MIKKTANKGGFSGRSGEVRTRGLLNPIQARYQAAPHPENMKYNITTFFENQQREYDFGKEKDPICEDQVIFKAKKITDGSFSDVRNGADHFRSSEGFHPE